MQQRVKVWPHTKWLISVALLAAGATVAVAIAPSDAQADCGAGMTCADFINEAGETFEICGWGISRDDMTGLQMWDSDTRQSVRYLGRVRP